MYATDQEDFRSREVSVAMYIPTFQLLILILFPCIFTIFHYVIAVLVLSLFTNIEFGTSGMQG
jgi:hypothetical protein